ncbi:cholesterol oxidase substrate-binding domain-containing protein [Streptomyces chartreusis]|uniref:cholesterol oxidase substrate-binding domain-containing protein n=1 Tax=Streptomyces chartreusis TaxID=1969 RepID=UPI0035E2927F
MLSGRSQLGPCVEWSKGCACTDDAAWSDGGVLESAAPGSFGEEGWGRAAGVLERLDPHRVLGNAFWDRLFAQARGYLRAALLCTVRATFGPSQRLRRRSASSCPAALSIR